MPLAPCGRATRQRTGRVAHWGLAPPAARLTPASKQAGKRVALATCSYICFCSKLNKKKGRREVFSKTAQFLKINERSANFAELGIDVNRQVGYQITVSCYLLEFLMPMTAKTTWQESMRSCLEVWTVTPVVMISSKRITLHSAGSMSKWNSGRILLRFSALIAS